MQKQGKQLNLEGLLVRMKMLLFFTKDLCTYIIISIESQSFSPRKALYKFENKYFRDQKHLTFEKR